MFVQELPEFLDRRADPETPEDKIVVIKRALGLNPFAQYLCLKSSNSEHSELSTASELSLLASFRFQDTKGLRVVNISAVQTACL